MERKEVYRIIDTERDYEDELHLERTLSLEDRTPQQSVGDFLTLLDTYVRRAQDEYSDKAGNIAALDVVRKIAGIAVFCMELHGAPERKSNKKHKDITQVLITECKDLYDVKDQLTGMGLNWYETYRFNFKDKNYSFMLIDSGKSDEPQYGNYPIIVNFKEI